MSDEEEHANYVSLALIAYGLGAFATFTYWINTHTAILCTGTFFTAAYLLGPKIVKTH